VVRNIGGSTGVALATTLLARRAQEHQSTLTSHIHAWNPAVAERLQDWTEHFTAQGVDSFTAARRAMAMLYRETQVQAQVLSYADDFWLLLVVFCGVVVLIPFMHRVRADALHAKAASPERDPGLPAAAE
jgi:MFS transporter, DHA2 family, multidrug resistance protein